MAGQLWLWGNNNYGQLGDNTTNSKSSPVQTVTGGTNWIATAGGNDQGYGSHRAAIKSDGTLWSWGANGSGQLGDNTITNRSSPVQSITGGTTWNKLSCGYAHTAAIKTDGTLWTWGLGNLGQLGDNSLVGKSSPAQTIALGTNWSSVACNFYTTAAIKTDGTLWIWGYNVYGQLGINTTTDKSSPIQTIAYGTNWSKVACGKYYTAAIKTDGTLWTWGYNNYGQLGDSTTTNKSSPVQTITYGTNWSSVACGYAITAATKSDGTLWTWGYNDFGGLGDNTTVSKSSPVQVVGYSTIWKSVSAEDLNVVATKLDGTLWTWGFNNYGQLGDNTTLSRSSPVQTIMAGSRWLSTSQAGNYGVSAIYENAPASLSITTQPAIAYNGQNLFTQPVLNLLDSGNNLTTLATNSVTASIVSGSLTIGGTTTVSASGGVAAFTNLSLTGIGTASILFTSSGLTSAISGPLSVKSPVAVMPKRSETASSVPTSGQLKVGELAINIADQKGYVKKSDGTIVNVFTGLTSGVIQNYMIASGAIIPDGGTF